ncbi:MAG: serine/threonine protein kinase [Polyangiaceae bacterium]|nr:serine/threonine protein kinase [Polyangiaceae bacterium]
MSHWPASEAAHSGVDPLSGALRPTDPGPEAPRVATPGSVPERWERRGEIGAGGMGTVAIVFDRWLGREVALKTPASDEDRDRLLREALVTARLDHPGIVAIFDAGTRPDGSPWFAMRLVRGRSLADQLAGATIADRPRLLRHVRAAADAVAYAHDKGVVHRDLKPANIMIGSFGETQVIDWGLALSPELPSPDPGRAGTPAAMSPEQARGEPLDRRADVYALGAILRQVLSGRPLFEATDRQTTLAALAADRVPPFEPDDVPPELVAIVRRAMAPRAADRYPDAQAFADDLGRWLDGARVQAHDYSALELARRLVAAWRVPLIVGGLALIALVTLMAIERSHVSDARDRSEEHLARALVLEDRVGAPVARGTSHRTGLVLFTSGSSGPRVATPVAGRFTTSSYPGLSTEARYILSSLALMQSVRGPFGSLRVAGPFRRPPIIGPVRLNSFAPIRLVLSSSSASAPSASQSVVRHGSIRNRRVGRCPPSSAVPRSVPVCPPVARPWSPSLRLRPCGRRFGAGFRRPCGNTRPSDFCRAIILRPFVLGTTARAEPGRSPWVRPAFFVATSSPIHPRLVRISDFAAGGRLTRRGCLTALRLRSIQPRTYDFHQTSPRGLLRLLSPSKDLVLQVDALVSSVSGSLRRAPGLDFHLLIAGHARRTPRQRSRARRGPVVLPAKAGARQQAT